MEDGSENLVLRLKVSPPMTDVSFFMEVGVDTAGTATRELNLDPTGKDYWPPEVWQLSMHNCQSGGREFSVSMGIYYDAVAEPDETVNLNLRPGNYTLGTKTNATVVIHNSIPRIDVTARASLKEVIS